MSEEQKKEIAIKLKEFVDSMKTKGFSQKKAADKLPVSEGYVIQIIKNNDYKSVSDEKWRLIAQAIGFSFSGWQIAETKPFIEMNQMFDFSATRRQVNVMVAQTSTGKSEAAEYYRSKNPDTAYVLCDSDMSLKEVYVEMLDSLGVSMRGTTYKQKKEVCKQLLKKNTPCVIIDEPQKLKTKFLYSLIGFVNMLKNNCGVTMIGTAILGQKINEFNASGDTTGTEFWSRIGGKIVQVESMTNEDLTAICKANNITEINKVGSLLSDSGQDSRRLRKLIEADEYKAQRSITA